MGRAGEGFGISLARSPPLLRLSPSQLCFRRTLSVRLRVGVKFKDFVNPLRVEGDVHEKRRLRRGALGPLDAHTDDNFALVFLAHQGTAVVFLGEERREGHLRETHQHQPGWPSARLALTSHTPSPLLPPAHIRLSPASPLICEHMSLLTIGMVTAFRVSS